MREQVLRHSRVIVIATESEIALLIVVYLEWVPLGDHDPDPDIELSIHDQHGVLDVLLDDPCLLRVHAEVFTNWLHMIHVVLRVRS